MKRALIISGGYLNIDFAKAYIETLSYDKVFAVDRGLEYALTLNLAVDYLIGDFDTLDETILQQYEEMLQQQGRKDTIKRYPVMKDATDTELAIQCAIEEDVSEITLIAANGTRLDHVLMNLGLLLQAAEQKIDMIFADETNRIRLLTDKYKKSCRIDKKEQYGTYISLVPMSSVVSGVSMTGVLYPLKDYTIRQGNSFTVSNQIVDVFAEIAIDKGNALLIESKDHI